MAYNFAEEENKILKFWADNKIFEKLREKNKGKKRWSFLDGPITANNPMGVHHAWGRTYKDLFQRYKAMQGFDERYQNGFDCQGLWVEVEVEKELGFKNKKDIEVYGIDKFVEKCKERVLKYSAIQTEQSIRLGQWMDWDNSYYTMSDENNYAIWHFLKKCWELGYLYKGRDSVPWCPRCGTAISQHEILTEEYKLITHRAIYFKMKVIGEPSFAKAYFLVWTTTPWTIPANVALIVNPDFEYGLYEGNGEKLIMLKNLADKVLNKEYILKKKIKGKDLKGIKYEGPFDNLPRVQKIRQDNEKTFHTVVLDKDLVTDVEGTGIVHCAPGAGEEDFKIGQKENLPVIDVIDDSAVYLSDMNEFSGKNAKEHPEIIFSAMGDWVFKLEDYQHRYPTCWRCKKELVWRVVDEWYISMDKLRKPLVDIVKKINWIPSFGKERELDWLKNMHDWLISKKRYWGLALPIFECECGSFEVIGSEEELKKRSVEGFDRFEGHTPHRPWVDNVKIKCKKCKKLVSRIKDVGNPWLDAGIVPFSTMPKDWFPAELICESFPGQFKNWFYSLLVMSAVLKETNPMKTIFGFASVRDEKGEEMHKSKGNAIWFSEAVQKVGADPMRWLYMRQNPADNLGFGYNVIEEVKRRLLTLYNSYVFFETYAGKSQISEKLLKVKPQNILDKWIISKTDHLINAVEFSLDKYDVAKFIVAVEEFFINDLSLWYIRRSRRRFHEQALGREQAVSTLYYVLLNLSKLVAPVMPFFAEKMYQQLRLGKMPESVHLCDWPKLKKEGQTDLELEGKIDEVRTVVALALAERAVKAIKIKQPLASLKIKNKELKIKNDKELQELIKDEVNVKQIIFDNKIKSETELDTNLTEELKEEGQVREIVRKVQDARKELGLKPVDKILIYFSCPGELANIIEKNKEYILMETRANDLEKEAGDKLLISIKKL